MKVRLTQNVNIPGGPRRAGEVVETEDWVAERLLAKGHAVPALEEVAAAESPVEHRDPDAEHRDPPAAKPKRGKAK